MHRTAKCFITLHRNALLWHVTADSAKLKGNTAEQNLQNFTISVQIC